MSGDALLLALVVLPTPVWALTLAGWWILRGPWDATKPGHPAKALLNRLALLRRLGPISSRERDGFGFMSIGVALLTLLATIRLVSIFNAHPSSYTLQFELPVIPVSVYLDSLSLFFLLVINLIALAATSNAFYYLKSDRTPGSSTNAFYLGPISFHVLMNLFHFTMILTPILDNLIGLWIAIESTTLVSALLVAYPNHDRAWEAAWKYLIITSTGIILAFMGTIFFVHGVYGLNIPALASMNWSDLIENMHLVRSQGNIDFVLLAFFFVLAGYGVKAGLAPMHTWLPDAHGEAAPPISALFSGVLLKAAFYAILRFVMLTREALQPEMQWLISYVLLGTGLVSLVVAVPFILHRKNHFKRVLAYHSLEHMGIIFFGAGLWNATSLFGSLFHVLNHAITKALMFLAYGNVIRRFPDATRQRPDASQPPQDPTGVLYMMPFTGLILAMGGLALVGTPPFSIFMSIWIILWGGFQRWQEVITNQASGHPWERFILPASIVIFVLATMFIYFGLVQHLARMLLNPSSGNRRIKERFLELLPLVILLALSFLLGLVILPPLATLLQHSVELLARI